MSWGVFGFCSDNVKQICSTQLASAAMEGRWKGYDRGKSGESENGGDHTAKISSDTCSCQDKRDDHGNCCCYSGS